MTDSNIQWTERLAAKALMALSRVAVKEMRFLVGQADWVKCGQVFGISLNDSLYTYNKLAQCIQCIENLDVDLVPSTYNEVPRDIMLGFASDLIVSPGVIPGTKTVKILGPYPFIKELVDQLTELLHPTKVVNDESTFTLVFSNGIMEYEAKTINDSVQLAIDAANVLFSLKLE